MVRRQATDKIEYKKVNRNQGNQISDIVLQK